VQHLNNTVHETMFQASLARSTGKKGGLEKQHLRIVRGMMSGTTRPARHTPRHLVLLCPQLGALVLQRHITPHGCNEAAESVRVLWLAPSLRIPISPARQSSPLQHMSPCSRHPSRWMDCERQPRTSHASPLPRWPDTRTVCQSRLTHDPFRENIREQTQHGSIKQT
jgi:hypothetical protein